MDYGKIFIKASIDITYQIFIEKKETIRWVVPIDKNELEKLITASLNFISKDKELSDEFINLINFIKTEKCEENIKTKINDFKEKIKIN